ncbi:MAG: sugar phosphate isomerase/epimerase family protein [Thermodesulfobacteriota bacterium]
MPGRYPHIASRCFVNAPFRRLQQQLDQMIANRLQPEIGLEGDTLYTASEAEFREVAKALTAAGLGCTLHAPFFDLAPGALDQEILAASRAKLRRAFALIPLFRPASVVCHLNFEANKHGYKEEAWFANSLATWQELLAMASAHRVPLMLENTYETEPSRHQRMLADLGSPLARFCFDAGHSLAFAKGHWRDWFPAMAPWLGQLHLHDNHGERDEHLAPGQGGFDFPGFFAYLRENQLAPLVTLEPHSEAGVAESLAALDRLRIFEK